MPTAQSKPDKPKRDSTALAFLIAMGIALATTAGVALTAGTGTLRRAMGAVSLDSEQVTAAEPTQAAPDVVRLEDRLEDLLGEIEILKSRPTGDALDQTVADRLSRLDQEIAQVKADIKELHSGLEAASWRDEVGTFRANFANTDIELSKLRTSIDERDESRRRAIADLSRRLERLEHVVASNEETGSIPSALRHRARPARSALSGWSVQDVQLDRAIINGQGVRYAVWPGTTVPGLGRVVSVSQRGGRGIVVTDKGTITQRPREAGGEDRGAPRSLFSAF
jgi:hypothetical protein